MAITHVPFEIRLRRSLHERAQAAMRQACRVPNRVDREDAERDARYAISLVLVLRKHEETMRDTESAGEFIAAAEKFAAEVERATEAINSIEGLLSKVDFSAAQSGQVSASTPANMGTSAAPAAAAPKAEPEPAKSDEFVPPWDNPALWDLSPEEFEEKRKKAREWGDV